jgi:hypothetical protein
MVGIISSATRSLSAVVVFAIGFAGMGVAYAQAPVQPTNCSLNFSGGKLTTQEIQQLRTIPGNRYFTDRGNTVSSQTAGSSTSVASVETSTAIVTEMIAERRMQEAVACPAGYENVRGICQPIRARIAERPSNSQTKSSSMTSIVGSPRGPQRTKPRDLVVNEQPVLEERRQNGIWSEILYDSEKRTGLGTASAPASRTQQTVEMLVGGDQTFRYGDTQLVLGGLGSLSSIKQSFSSSSSAVQDTSFIARVDPGLFIDSNGQGVSAFEYVIPTEHSFVNSQKQTLKGGAVGLTASWTRGGFFSDGLFKANISQLDRTSTSAETYATQLTNLSIDSDPAQLGCIDAYSNPQGQVISQPYSFGPSQTFRTTLNQGTTAVNLVFANNVGYHFQLNPNWWVEPLAGATFFYSAYGPNAAALGLRDGQDLRLQAGARLGFTAPVGEGFLTASFAQIVYSDVYIRGYVTNPNGFSAGAILADQGKLRYQSIATAKYTLPNGFSIFLQGQGRFGTDYYGYGGRLGARYEF